MIRVGPALILALLAVIVTTPENAETYFEDVRGKLGGTGRGLEG